MDERPAGSEAWGVPQPAQTGGCSTGHGARGTGCRGHGAQRMGCRAWGVGRGAWGVPRPALTGAPAAAGGCTWQTAARW